MRTDFSNNKTLPHSDLRTSKLGYAFDVYADEWRLDNSVKINWNLVNELELDGDFVIGLRKTLAVFASEVSASYVDNIDYFLRALFRKTGDKSLRVATIQNYLSMLGKDEEYKLGSIKGFILDWHAKGFEGISDEVAEFLQALTLRGNVKGKAVAKGCPHSGAYSLQEQQSILEWAVNDFMDDKLDLKEYAWLLVNMYTGSRPAQLRNLAKEDLDIQEISSGEMNYALNIPRVKRRGLGFREDFHEKDIDEDLALLLFNLSESSVRRIEDCLNYTLSEELRKKTPIFLNEDRLSQISSASELTKILKNTPDVLFMTGSQSAFLMSTISHKCQARTERLDGEFIHLTSRRFRYTVATNVARRGYGAHYIAEILGHRDIQNVKVYTENTSKDLELIDEAMSQVLAPLAQAFAGTLIESEKEAIRANDPRSRIKSNDGSGVGNCGEYGFCASGGRQCYLCVKFQPWVYGNHQAVLDNLNAERASLKQRGASQFVIQATDRVHMAVTQVIQMCDDWKAKNQQGDVIDG